MPPEPALSPDDARDIALLHAHRAGDASALSDLLEAYQDRLFGVCLRMTSDHERARDLTQEAMVKIIQGLDQFGGRSKLSTWMIRVTMNVCLTSLRKQKLRRHLSLDLPQGWRGSRGSGGLEGSDGRTIGSAMADEREPEASDHVEQSEDRQRLYEGMSRLDPNQRAMLILRDVQGLDYRQIARIMDIPEGTVKSRLFRARVALREQIEAATAAATRRV